MFYYWYTQYTPLISENSQQYVHHIVIYECPQLDESVVGAGGHCDGEISNSVGQCRLGTVLAVWAVGGEVGLFFFCCCFFFFNSMPRSNNNNY